MSSPRTKSAGPSAPAHSGPNPWLLAAGVIAVTFLIYLPSLRGAVLWDDDGHVTKPELRSIEGLWRIWFDLGASQQYYPMLHTAFWVEHRLWGDATIGYHLVNILLHSLSACLLALVLTRLRRPDEAAGPGPAPAGAGLEWPWLAAAIFAVHPICVESVAWISEQKNTLSGVFYLLAALSFLGFNRELAGRKRWQPALGWYLLASFLFFFALLSKTVTATLPAALLVALWWKRGRLAFWRDIAPLVPWFLAGAVMGLFTAWVERNVIGAEGATYDLSWVQRGLIAGRVIWFYLGKDLWPAKLIFVYPHWTIDARAIGQYLFPLGIAVLLYLLALPIIRRGSTRATRAPLAGFLFFSGTLFPVLGFFNIYPFRFSYVADHFQYLASIGIICLVAGGFTAGLAHLRERGGRGAVYCSAGGAAVLLLLCVLTWRQCGMYRNDETLYTTTLRRNPECWMAENNLGTYLSNIPERHTEALGHFLTAIRINPDYVQGHNNLGSEYSKMPGRLDDALAELETAVRIAPKYPDARNNLGLVLAKMGRLPEAEEQFRTAIALKPDFAEAHNDLGITLGERGQFDPAIAEFNESLRLRPDYNAARKNLAVALARAGRLPEAIAEFEELGRLMPDDPQVQRTLAAIRQHMGGGQ